MGLKIILMEPVKYSEIKNLLDTLYVEKGFEIYLNDNGTITLDK